MIPGTVDGDVALTALGRHPLVVAGDTGAVDVVLRPERVRLQLDGAGEGVVHDSVYFGHDQLVSVRLADGTRVRSRMGPGPVFESGDRVSVTVTGPVVTFPARQPADETSAGRAAARSQLRSG